MFPRKNSVLIFWAKVQEMYRRAFQPMGLYKVRSPSFSPPRVGLGLAGLSLAILSAVLGTCLPAAVEVTFLGSLDSLGQTSGTLVVGSVVVLVLLSSFACTNVSFSVANL